MKTIQKSVYIPDDLLPIAERRQRHERYDSFSSYIVGLIIFDAYCKREHKMTGPLMREPQYIRDEVIEQLCKEFDTAPQQHGWFEKRVEELIEAEIAKRKAAGLIVPVVPEDPTKPPLPPMKRPKRGKSE